MKSRGARPVERAGRRGPLFLLSGAAVTLCGHGLSPRAAPLVPSRPRLQPLPRGARRALRAALGRRRDDALRGPGLGARQGQADRLEGRAIEPEEMGMGRGWATSAAPPGGDRDRARRGASAGPRRRSAVETFKAVLRGAARAPDALRGGGGPGRRPSIRAGGPANAWPWPSRRSGSCCTRAGSRSPPVRASPARGLGGDRAALGDLVAGRRERPDRARARLTPARREPRSS